MKSKEEVVTTQAVILASWAQPGGFTLKLRELLSYIADAQTAYTQEKDGQGDPGLRATLRDAVEMGLGDAALWGGTPPVIQCTVAQALKRFDHEPIYHRKTEP